MNWVISKTTANERATISDAMCFLFADLERAETLLCTVIEDCFGEVPQKAISASQAEWIGTMLEVAREILSDTIVSYYLTVADTKNPRAKLYIDAAETVKAAMQCEDAFDSVFNWEKKLPRREAQGYRGGPQKDRRYGGQGGNAGRHRTYAEWRK